MGRRGRPPNNGLLTEREHEVLDLIRRGLSNAEIADRLAIARETVKWHVSEILSKLGVETREAAAAWPQEELLEGRSLRRLGGVALILRLAGASLVAATVAGVAVFGWAVISTSGGDNGDQAVAATASSNPARPISVPGSATPTPTAVAIESGAPSPFHPPTPTPQLSLDNYPPIGPLLTDEPSTPAFVTPTPTPTPSPTLQPPSTEHDTPPTPAHCTNDYDCDGWSDDIEIKYGSDPFLASSTPENSDFDALYGQSSCSDGIDNNGDGNTDRFDAGCGGWGTTPTQRPVTPTPTPPPLIPTPQFTPTPFPLPT
jgi:DNA-binding CsgD family transcriptional regulator